MHRMLKTTLALALAVGAVSTAGATTATAGTGVTAGTTAVAAASHGCDSGYVCFYPGAGWNGDRPSHRYYNYGTYNLSNMFGTYRIFNNQTGGAIVRTCTGYNGTGCQGDLPAGWYIDKDMTPINSIVLAP
ncbi:hypothetical protein ACFVGM_33120 [Kitasatospora purpeofusca]|uniref:hypothetical protein n=1 Tax=Kitasatospora purpeofusca TaxID=67352 RepID=UPI0036983B23